MAKSADRAEFIARRKNIAAKKAAGKKLYIGDEFVVEGAVASKPEKVTKLEPAPKLEATTKTPPLPERTAPVKTETKATTPPPLPPKRTASTESATKATTPPPLPPKRTVSLEDYKALEKRIKSLEGENDSLTKRVKTLELGNEALWKRAAHLESRIVTMEERFEKMSALFRS